MFNYFCQFVNLFTLLCGIHISIGAGKCPMNRVHLLHTCNDCFIENYIVALENSQLTKRRFVAYDIE